MPRSRSSHSLFSFVTLTLTLIFCISSSPSVLAQVFRPNSTYNKCSAFVDGQALYLLGGFLHEENFLLDLSVSWNASDPVYKKIEGGPKVDRRACATTDNGEDLFVMSAGAGYVYNVKSNKWRTFPPNANFAASTLRESEYFAATDPETGFIYLPDGGTDFTGRALMLSVDVKTETVNTTGSNPYTDAQPVWNAHLKSMVVPGPMDGLMTFTPSKATESTGGWSQMKTTPGNSWDWDCGASTYDGSIMVIIGGIHQPYVYMLDVDKQTWKQGPPLPREGDFGRSCAVSGDQFIVWGGSILATYANTTLVFNIKTEKWVSRYIPPPPRPTTTTSQTPTQNTATPEPGDTSSTKEKTVIIAAVTAALLATTLGLILGYCRRTRQPNFNGSSAGSLDTKDGVNTVEPGLAGQIHQGSFGPQLVSKRPNVIIDDPTTRRGVQEGALATHIPQQHPHAIVGDQGFAIQIPPQHPHTIGKQELEEQ